MAPRIVVLLSLCSVVASAARAQPYPPSPVITGVSFDRATHDRRAPGSDNWPITWADDDHQYTSWGDGGGFGGTNSNGRVSLGFARVEGDSDAYTGFNVWGGFMPEVPATFEGKSYGVLSVDGSLYEWVSPGSGPTGYQRATVHRSDDHGRTWTGASWAFRDDDGIIFPTFLNYGRDYAGARDDYVYVYANHLTDSSDLAVQRPGEIALLRVPRAQIMERAAYELWAGPDTWTDDLTMRQPVFEDADGVGWNTSVSFNAGLGRYVLCTEHTASIGGYLGIFDAPEPWGPWTTVLYVDGDWEGFGTTFFWSFANKWVSADGRDFTMVFTGTGPNDSWNTIDGTFSVAPRPDAGATPGTDGGRGDAGGTDGGGTSGVDAGPSEGADDGCGCRAAGSRGAHAWPLALMVGLVVAGRRRRGERRR